jgi:NAD(P)-dependent dehydrogenase (short-subunit alcohol dehydrogenase family)
MIGEMRSAPVLITGCSSGIGRAAAISLHAASDLSSGSDVDVEVAG